MTTVLGTTLNVGIFLGPGIHSARPATGLGGTLYVCTTHDVIEKYDLTAGWQDWATITGGGGGVVDAADVTFTPVGTISATDAQAAVAEVDDSLTHQSEVLMIAVSDEATAITTGTAKVTFRMPFAMTLTAVRASLTTASSSGIPTVDINEAGTTILSTKLTIDATEKTSTTAATAAVISDTSLADDAEITIDIDTAGTGAKGLKVTLIGTRT